MNPVGNARLGQMVYIYGSLFVRVANEPEAKPRVHRYRLLERGHSPALWPAELNFVDFEQCELIDMSIPYDGDGR